MGYSTKLKGREIAEVLKLKTKMKTTILLISAILGTLYFVYIVVYFTGAVGGSTSDAEMVGAAIASFLVYPHIFMVFLATLFNWLGFGLSSRGLSLTGGILYCVAAALFPMYVFFVILQIILSFVGFAKLKK